MNYDGIIFDLDGTLWSTIESCMESIKYVKDKHKEITREITVNEVISSVGLPFDDIVQIYYSYLEKDKAEKYAKEAFNKNIENLMQNGGKITDVIEVCFITIPPTRIPRITFCTCSMKRDGTIQRVGTSPQMSTGR